MERDEQLRRSVAKALASEPVAFNELARERIARAVQAQGPALASPKRRRRSFAVYAWAGGGLAATAVCAALWVRLPQSAVSTQDSRLCAQRTNATGPILHTRQGGELELDFPIAALARATVGTTVDVISADRCDIKLRLTQGDLLVHARDLGGGSLTVVTPQGQVQVRGTVFSVHVDKERMHVEVAHGKVQVDGVPQQQHGLLVQTGQGVQTNKRGFALNELTPDRIAAIRLALSSPDAPAKVSPPPLTVQVDVTAEDHPKLQPEAARPSPARVRLSPKVAVAPSVPVLRERLLDAESLRRAGHLNEARKLFREVGKEQGATAEAAWLGLARLELDARDGKAAKGALAVHSRRFPRGLLDAEALWIGVRADRLRGDLVSARTTARALIKQSPSSPQAQAAKAFLSEPMP